MKRARIYMHEEFAGILEEINPGKSYVYTYADTYEGPSISLTMPRTKAVHQFDRFPPYFEGLLPEGNMLEGLLRQRKLDRADAFGQLLAVGQELVGAVTVEAGDSPAEK